MTTSNTPLREAIKNRVAPNAHIDHQNIRPHAFTLTEIGVDYATDKLEALFQEAQRQLLTELLDGAEPVVLADGNEDEYVGFMAVPVSVIQELLDGLR